MAKVETHNAMVGKKIKLLDGTRTKIEKVLTASYRLDSGDKIPARKVLQKGKAFVETDLTMRDLEDTGNGFVVKAEDDSSSKKTTKSKKSKTSSAGTKQSSSSKKKTGSGKKKKTKVKKFDRDAAIDKLYSAKVEKKTKLKKMDDEDLKDLLEELESEAKSSKSKGRRKTSKAEKEETKKSSSKSKKKTKAKAEKEDTVQKETKQKDLDLSVHSESTKLNNLLRNLVEEALGSYKNIESLRSETLISDDNASFEFRLQGFVEVAEPEHHSKAYYLALAEEVGAKTTVKLKQSMQNKIAQRLMMDDEEEEFELTVGDILLDEGAEKLVYAGVDVDSKEFVLISVATDEAQKIKLSGFENLDWPGATVESLGLSIEDVEEQKESSEDDVEDFEIDGEIKTPIAELDWENTDRDVLIDLLSDNYTKDEIVDFIHASELEADEDELDVPVNELIEILVDTMTETDDSFEDDEVEVEDDDGMEDELDSGEVEDDDGMEDELDSGEVEDDLEEEYEEAAEDLAEQVDVDAMRKELVAEGYLKAKRAAKMSDEKIVDMYERLTEEESEEDEDEVSIEEKLQALIAEKIVSFKQIGKMSEKQIEDLYAENFDSEEESVDEDEDLVDSEDEDMFEESESEEDEDEDEDMFDEDEDFE